MITISLKQEVISFLIWEVFNYSLIYCFWCFAVNCELKTSIRPYTNDIVEWICDELVCNSDPDDVVFCVGKIGFMIQCTRNRQKTCCLN